MAPRADPCNKIKLFCKSAAPVFALWQIVPAKSTSTTTTVARYFILYYFILLRHVRTSAIKQPCNAVRLCRDVLFHFILF